MRTVCVTEIRRGVWWELFVSLRLDVMFDEICLCVPEELMHKTFSQFGPIQEVRVFKDKGYAFIRWDQLLSHYWSSSICGELENRLILLGGWLVGPWFHAHRPEVYYYCWLHLSLPPHPGRLSYRLLILNSVSNIIGYWCQLSGFLYDMMVVLFRT